MQRKVPMNFRSSLSAAAPVVPVPPKASTVHGGQLERLEQAKKWFENSFKLGDARMMKMAALDDSELEPPWKDIGGV
jgi:hypothetical protein